MECSASVSVSECSSPSLTPSPGYSASAPDSSAFSLEGPPSGSGGSSVISIGWLVVSWTFSSLPRIRASRVDFLGLSGCSGVPTTCFSATIFLGSSGRSGVLEEYFHFGATCFSAANSLHFSDRSSVLEECLAFGDGAANPRSIIAMSSSQLLCY